MPEKTLVNSEIWQYFWLRDSHTKWVIYVLTNDKPDWADKGNKLYK